jgi:hypothetical protein
VRVRRPLLVASLTLLLPVVASACSGREQQGSAVHRMSVWVKGSGLGEDIGTLIADNARVPKDVPNGTGAVHAACGTLLVDAERANGQLPSPDALVTDLLTQAYGLEGTAGNDCYSAGSTNPALLAKARHDGIKAEALYTQALQRIAAIDGRSVATTTTTDNSPGSIFG